MPRRKPGTAKDRAARLHGIAHIEFNAVDLHWDMVARFAGAETPAGVFDDWVRAGDAEARHFTRLSERREGMALRMARSPRMT